jgi:hypothetical protein
MLANVSNIQGAIVAATASSNTPLCPPDVKAATVADVIINYLDNIPRFDISERAPSS